MQNVERTKAYPVIYCNNQPTLQDILETLMVAAVMLAIAIDKSRRSKERTQEQEA